MYVYPLPAHLTEESLYANLTANDHDFHFSGELWRRQFGAAKNLARSRRGAHFPPRGAA